MENSSFTEETFVYKDKRIFCSKDARVNLPVYEGLHLCFGVSAVSVVPAFCVYMNVANYSFTGETFVFIRMYYKKKTSVFL